MWPKWVALVVLWSGTLASAAIAVPNLTATPTSIAYGSVAVGGQSDQLFTLKNTGTGSVTVTGFTFSGAGASQFALVSPPSTPFSLGTGASQPITVRFAPTSTGAKSAVITVANDAGGSAVTVSLNGTGVTPTVPALSPAIVCVALLILGLLGATVGRRRVS